MINKLKQHASKIKYIAAITLGIILHSCVGSMWERCQIDAQSEPASQSCDLSGMPFTGGDE